MKIRVADVSWLRTWMVTKLSRRLVPSDAKIIGLSAHTFLIYHTIGQIQNDFDIGEDKNKMIAQLKSRGIDVKSISWKGSVDEPSTEAGKVSPSKLVAKSPKDIKRKSNQSQWHFG